MHKQTRYAIAYAQNLLSFLFLDETISSSIRKIFLYGSAVRGQLHNKSDIDLFIDCPEPDVVERKVTIAIQRFYQSQDYQKWKLLKFTYPLIIHTGILDEWQLKSSINAQGMLLYSKSIQVQTGNRYDLFFITLPTEKKKYLHLTRTLFGRNEKGYKDKGLLGKLQGKRYGPNVILVPKEKEFELLHFFGKEKVNYSFKEIWLQE